MKLILGVLCLSLLLGVYSCSPLSFVEEKPVDLMYICMHLTVKDGYRADKAPIILLHGMFAFKETWYGLMQLLALRTARKVCAADLRNHGASPWSEEFNTVALAKDVERLLVTLKAEKVIMLGHSLGGKTAVHFTLTNPEKVEKLIVEDMRPNGLGDPNLGKTLQIKELAELSLKAIPEGASDKEAKRAVYNLWKDMYQKSNISLDWDDAIVDNFPIECSSGKCKWKTNVDVINKASLDIEKLIPDSHGQFDRPALFIYGGKSPFKVGDDKEEILKLFPKAELVEVKEASHLVNTFPQYKEEVLKFILK